MALVPWKPKTRNYFQNFQNFQTFRGDNELQTDACKKLDERLQSCRYFIFCSCPKQFEFNEKHAKILDTFDKLLGKKSQRTGQDTDFEPNPKKRKL